jgi:hypothetical protein
MKKLIAHGEAAHGITGKGQNGPATLNQPPT